MPDTQTAKTRLQAQLADLKARLAHIEADLAEPLNADWSERAIETEDDASLEAQAALVSSEIKAVIRALDRIEAAIYGTCLKCGGEIAPARLEARPEASFCIKCAP